MYGNISSNGICLTKKNLCTIVFSVILVLLSTMKSTNGFKQNLDTKVKLSKKSSWTQPTSTSSSRTTSRCNKSIRGFSRLNMAMDPTTLCSCGICDICGPSGAAISLFSSMPSMLLSDGNSYGGGVEGTNLSLYFTLALYLFTLPGLYSLVTRSVKVKDIQKNYDLPGPANPTAKSTRQIAGEIMAYFKALNYEITAAEDVITFKGLMGKSKSQAAFLTFCTFVGLGSMGLVISILNEDIGAKAYALTLLSPYAGIFYWNNAQRIDTVKVRMETSDNEQLITVTAQGGKEDIERFAKTLQLPERGKVYMKGIFEDDALPTEVTELVKDSLEKVASESDVQASDEVSA